ncbi:MAG: hypothetical protein JKY49_03585 [Cohaesibacteraceae bacterium]|nr:hypothetical protein [Cohaesibacteraceae bacterium]
MISEIVRNALIDARFGYGFFASHVNLLWRIAAVRIISTLLTTGLLDLTLIAIETHFLQVEFVGKYFGLMFFKLLIFVVSLSTIAVAWHHGAAGLNPIRKSLIPNFSETSRTYALAVMMISAVLMGSLMIVVFLTNTIAGGLSPMLGINMRVLSTILTFTAGTFTLGYACRYVPLIAATAHSGKQIMLAARVSTAEAWSILFMGSATLLPVVSGSRYLRLELTELWATAAIPLTLISELGLASGILVFLAALSHRHAINIHNSAAIES